MNGDVNSTKKMMSNRPISEEQNSSFLAHMRPLAYRTLFAILFLFPLPESVQGKLPETAGS